MSKLYFYLLLILVSASINAQTVWTGPSTTFTKAGFANPAVAANQDQITANVWLTRGDTRGMYNIKKEASYSGNSPNDTEWATGTIDSYTTLSYTNWVTWFDKSPGGIVNKNAVVHLISENIYIGIKFLSWGQATAAGGSFSYQRTTASTLPVILKGFTATSSGNNAILNWITASEINNSYFDIEHSMNGAAFSSVGRVNGGGGSSTDHSYFFTHKNIRGGKNYYRLAQHDNDGAIKYSGIIQLTSLVNKALDVIPNPATSFINVNYASGLTGSLYTITSAVGQIVKSGVIDSRPIEVRKLPGGQYWLMIKTKDGEQLETQFLKN